MPSPVEVGALEVTSGAPSSSANSYGVVAETACGQDDLGSVHLGAVGEPHADDAVELDDERVDAGTEQQRDPAVGDHALELGAQDVEDAQRHAGAVHGARRGVLLVAVDDARRGVVVLEAERVEPRQRGHRLLDRDAGERRAVPCRG